MVFHTNLIAITFLITDHDLDRLFDRNFNRRLDSSQISMTCTLLPSYFKLVPQFPSVLI